MRRAVVPFAALGLGLALVAGPALPALAHDYVVSTTPEAGGTVTGVPDFFVVTASEAMLDLGGAGAGFAIQVSDESGLYYGDGCVDVGGPSMSMAGALGDAGQYTMAFQYVSSDGHTLSDTLTFQYEPVGDVQASTGVTGPPSCGKPEPAAVTGEAGADGSTTSAPVEESVAVVTTVALIGGGIVLVALIAAVAVWLARRARS
jgi:hypothetical protein